MNNPRKTGLANQIVIPRDNKSLVQTFFSLYVFQTDMLNYSNL